MNRLLRIPRRKKNHILRVNGKISFSFIQREKKSWQKSSFLQIFAQFNNTQKKNWCRFENPKVNLGLIDLRSFLYLSKVFYPHPFIWIAMLHKIRRGPKIVTVCVGLFYIWYIHIQMERISWRYWSSILCRRHEFIFPCLHGMHLFINVWNRIYRGVR